MNLDKAILESLTIPLLTVEREGGVRFGNTAAGLFWRLPPEKLCDYTVQGLFSGDGRVSEAVRRAVDGDASSTIEDFRLEQGRGLDSLNIRIQVDPVLVPGRPGELALIALWDETHRERLDSYHREEDLMDSIGLMVRRLAHELQNPLSGIKGATQLLARRLAKLPGHAEYPDVILKELERLERLVKNLLIHGAEPPLARVSFNLHALLDDVLWFVSNSGAEVNLEREYDPSLPELSGDRDRMHQAFLNLLCNAVEASPPGGTVRVRTEMTGPWQERETLPDPARTYFQIEIEDEGEGLPNGEPGRIFTPFFTTKKSGTGLGLSISYQIVRAHEGHLSCRTGAAGGAVFTVRLPLNAN